MEHPVFEIQKWLDQYPLSSEIDSPDASAVRVSQITSPIHACTLLQVREVVHGMIDWQDEVPVDILVWSLGEPTKAYLTKIGGIPYRPITKPWPCDNGGEPMWFVAQFCFADSRDLVGPIPGDVLLIFSEKDDHEFQNLRFEWHDIVPDAGDCRRSLPPSHSPFDTIYGNLFRINVFPNGRPKKGFSSKWPLIHVGRWYYHSLDRLLRVEGTQFGRAPFWIQDEQVLPGTIIATLSSPSPAVHSSYPWVNFSSPLFGANEWPSREDEEGRLMIGDVGSIYISVDAAGDVHYAVQYY